MCSHPNHAQRLISKDVVIYFLALHINSISVMYNYEPEYHPPYDGKEGGLDDYKSSRHKSKREGSVGSPDNMPLIHKRKREGSDGSRELRASPNNATKKITRAEWDRLSPGSIASSRVHIDGRGHTHQSRQETKRDLATGEEYTLFYSTKTSPRGRGKGRGRGLAKHTSSKPTDVLTVKVKKIKTQPHAPRANRERVESGLQRRGRGRGRERGSIHSPVRTKHRKSSRSRTRSLSF